MARTHRVTQPLVDEYLGADGGLWHLLGCGHVVAAWCYESGDLPARRTCYACAGDPVPGPPAPTAHHAACCCLTCDGTATPKREGPRDPESPEEWQEAVDLANAMLHLDSARQYGLLTGGPDVDLERCARLLVEGNARGFTPKRDPAGVIVAMMGAPGQPHATP